MGFQEIWKIINNGKKLLENKQMYLLYWIFNVANKLYKKDYSKEVKLVDDLMIILILSGKDFILLNKILWKLLSFIKLKEN